jgi:hypothetical protein
LKMHFNFIIQDSLLNPVPSTRDGVTNRMHS